VEKVDTLKRWCQKMVTPILLLKSGKNIMVTEGELFSHVEGGQKLVATMVGTIMSVYDREGIENY